MISCDECQKKIVDVFDNEGSEEDKNLISAHIENCSECRAFSIEVVKIRQALVSDTVPTVSLELPQECIQENKINSNKDNESDHKEETNAEELSTKFRLLVWVGSLAAAFLIISFLTVFFILTRNNANLRNELEIARQDNIPTPIGDSVTINLYLKEHQDLIAQQASLNSAALQPIQMQINQDDIMYYEFLDDHPELLNSGIMVRGSASQQEIDVSKSPLISNGHALTFSEAQEAIDFEIILPTWFHPCYVLDQIRKIESRDAIHMLYFNSINSVSLFEQPLGGQNGLSHQDFREYAVYNNQGENGGNILAWRDDTLSYVLIGNIELSKLMDMAQSISAGK